MGGYIKGRNKNRLTKKCKMWEGERVYDHCPDRCGRKAGVGSCAHLEGQKKGKRKKISNTTTNNTVEAVTFGSFVKPEHNTAETERVIHSNTNIFSSSSNRATEAIATTASGSGSGISSATISNSRGQVYSKNDTW